MSILVIGGTGTVGSQVVRGLRAKDAQVRVMTRAPDKARFFPDGVDGALGDLAEPRTLPAALAGIEKLFLVTPLSREEAKLGLAGVEAARNAGLSHIVYMSVYGAEAASHIPHFASKIAIVDAIKASEIPYTIIQPNDFFQNDLRYAEPIARQGIYPQPIGPVGVSRVDVRDIARAAVNALTRPGHEGEAYPLVGPRALTGEQVAEVWSRCLGRDVAYAGDDLDAWETEVAKRLPAALVEDLRTMYWHYIERGLAAGPEELERCALILGRAPRSLDTFASEASRFWKSR